MHLFGVHIDETTYEDVLENIHDRLSSAQQTRLFTPNPEMLLQASRDDEYAGILDSADISVPDGMGLFVAYQACRDGLQTYPYQTLPLVKYLMLPWWGFRAMFDQKRIYEKYGERITGADLTKDILQIAASEKIRVVIVDREVTAGETSEYDLRKKKHQKRVVSVLQEQFPGLDVEHVCVGDSVETQCIVSLPSTQPCILLCTIGGKQQETLVHNLMEQNENVILGAGIGGSIDLITGLRDAAPGWVRNLGLEWLFRLVKRPRKHARRIGNVVKFLFECIKVEG